MATVTHIITSRYDPQDRELLERETGQLPDDDGDSKDPWQTESSLAARKRMNNPPRFVPATIPDSGSSLPPTLRASPPQVERDDHAGWYRALTSRSSTPRTGTPTRMRAPSNSAPSKEQPNRTERITRDNWFIKNVLDSQPAPDHAPPPTLADILARDPPDATFVPPVFLTLGPSNRGFAMLQDNYGWREGEALGPNAKRRRMTEEVDVDGMLGERMKVAKGKAKEELVKREVVEVELGEDGDDVRELKHVDIVDLTLSDSDDDEHEPAPSSATVAHSPSLQASPSPSSIPPDDSTHRALITPLPTILKSDRLGLGLKAKTTGPYKESKKRVTHNAAALAAHIRASEDAKRRRAHVGRGARGFARERKAEEESRRQIMAYFNE